MPDLASAPILDVRDEAAFLAGHPAGAVNIPVAEIKQRTHELPPKGATVRLFDTDEGRLAVAAHMLRTRGYDIEEVTLSTRDPAQTDLVEVGPSKSRLWQPSPFLVEAAGWIDAHAAAAATATPGPRRALDLACGAGREAVYLALRGWRVDAIDVLPDALQRAADLARRCGVAIHTIQQDLKRQVCRGQGVFRGEGVSPLRPEGILPTASSSSSSAAAAASSASVGRRLRKEGTEEAGGRDPYGQAARRTQGQDAPATFSIGCYDLVVVFRFLHRPLLPAIARSVAPGGYIVYETFGWRDASRRGPAGCVDVLPPGVMPGAMPLPVRGEGHVCNPVPIRPNGTSSRPRMGMAPGRALHDGELAAAFEGFETIIVRDGVQRDGRCFSQLLARKPAP